MQRSALIYRLALMLSMMLVSSVSDARVEKPSAKYWNEAGMNFDVAVRKLEPLCYLDSINLLACIQSMNVVANSLKTPSAFAAAEQVALESEYYGNKIASYGSLSLYELKVLPTPKSGLAAWKLMKESRENQVVAVKHLFANSVAAHFSMAEIVKALKPKVLVDKLADSEGLLASNMVNVYLSSAVDPHTHINAKQEFIDQSSDANESFAGIGMIFGPVANQITVLGLRENSPAFASGLHKGDLITAVDGKTTVNLNVEQVKNMLMGAENTALVLSVLRKGQAFSFKIIRKMIEVKNIESKVLNDEGQAIGYIRLASFQDEKACNSIGSALDELTAKHIKGLVLDLRGNGGGDVKQSVCIASLFMGPGQVIAIQKNLQTGQQLKMGVNGNFHPFALPMVTLVDAGSASASEIVSGALQDSGRSWIAGQRSFGKATVQQSAAFPMDATKTFYREFVSEPDFNSTTILAFHTIARFYQPSGRTNQIVGIEPDFEIDPVPHATDEQKFATREADLYTNALPAVGKPWVNPRKPQIAILAGCLKSKAQAEALYEAHKEDPFGGDYQIYGAEDILNCVNSN